MRGPGNKVNTPVETGQSDRRVNLVLLYLCIIIGLGVAIFAWTFFHWHSDDGLRFASFLIAAAIASILKTRLPGVTETFSVSVLVLAVAIAHLQLSEAVVISAVGMFVQCTWHATTKPRVIQVVFSICALAISVCTSALVYGYVRGRTIEVLSVGVIAAVYFATNSLLVAAIVSLTEKKSLLTVWNANRWALAYNCAGASLAWLLGTLPRAVQWELPIICLPLVYLVYRSNKVYLRQIEHALREDSLLRSQEELERRVEIRTSELGRANLALQLEIENRKRTEIDLRFAKEAAEVANKAKSEFLANVSHELRTPMNGIIGMTELALGTDLTAEQREYLRTVMFSANAMMTVVNDVLDFAKIDAHKLKLDPIEFHLSECVGEAIKSLAAEARQKGLELLCSVSPRVPETVIGDPYRLRQILLNLLGNAIKFTDRGEVAVSVDAEAESSNTVRLHFAVIDTGIGIPAEKLGLIFQAFTQADGSWTRKYGGTGLGLAISSRLVHLMHGEIWVDSQPGRGSTFRFTSVLGCATSEIVSPQYSQLRGLRILVVDDNATSRGMLANTLGGYAMRPILAANAQEAINACKEHGADGKISLALIDHEMPEIDGFALVDELRKSSIDCGPIIMLSTSSAKPNDAAAVGELAVAKILSKPVLPEELLQAISIELGHKLRKEVRPEPSPGPLRATNATRILVAEDTPANQVLLLELLRTRGYLAEGVKNGQEALAALESQSFDLVLMDLQMPEMNGIEATAIIRDKEKASGAHLPVIAVTAHAMPGDRERCFEAGMDGYLSKPLRSPDLFETIGRFTVTHGQMRANEDPVASQLSQLAQNLRWLDEIEAAINARDMKSVQGIAGTMKRSLTSLIAKDTFQAVSLLTSAANESDLARAKDASQCLHDALDCLTRT